MAKALKVSKGTLIDAVRLYWSSISSEGRHFICVHYFIISEIGEKRPINKYSNFIFQYLYLSISAVIYLAIL